MNENFVISLRIAHCEIVALTLQHILTHSLESPHITSNSITDDQCTIYLLTIKSLQAQSFLMWSWNYSKHQRNNISISDNTWYQPIIVKANLLYLASIIWRGSLTIQITRYNWWCYRFPRKSIRLFAKQLQTSCIWSPTGLGKIMKSDILSFWFCWLADICLVFNAVRKYYIILQTH